MQSAVACWIALRQVIGVGARIYRLILEKFGTPERAFEASASDIAAIGVPRQTAYNVSQFRDFTLAEKQLCELPRIGARLVRWTDPEYPPNLKHIADPPPFLFVRGDAPLTDSHCVAIVGARAASDGGRRMAQRLGFELAAKGFTVVSGLARGIDGEAHQGALDAGGRTIAVMGCGIDVIYPAEHRKLAEAIIEKGGALMSELPVGTQPLAENFPTRNRILSGLALGVVVVEAAEKSGSLISARMALEQDRQVFAVPGSPVSGKARGSNRLLKEGAKLVECVEDVIEELAPQLALGPKMLSIPQPSSAKREKTEKSGGNSQTELEQNTVDEAKLILEALKHDERLHVDSIIEATALKTQIVLRLLLELELRGLVAQHPGKLFSLA